MITMIPCSGYGTVEQREKPPPKRKFHTKRGKKKWKEGGGLKCGPRASCLRWTPELSGLAACGGPLSTSCLSVPAGALSSRAKICYVEVTT